MKNVAYTLGFKTLTALLLLIACSFTFANTNANVEGEDIGITIEIPDNNPNGEIVIRLQKGKPTAGQGKPMVSSNDNRSDEDDDEDDDDQGGNGPFLIADMSQGISIRVVGSNERANELSHEYLRDLGSDSVEDFKGSQRSLFMVDEMGYPVRVLSDGSMVDADAEEMASEKATARTITLEIAGQKVQLSF